MLGLLEDAIMSYDIGDTRFTTYLVYQEKGSTMAKKIPLAVMLYALETCTQGEHDGYYFDIETDKPYYLTGGFKPQAVISRRFTVVENDDALFKEITGNPERYIKLPTIHDVDGAALMEEFSVDHGRNAKKNRELKKAASKVRVYNSRLPWESVINRQFLRDEWQPFSDGRNAEHARKWCAEHGYEVVQTVGY